MNFGNCVALTGWYLFFLPASGLLYVGGLVFDGMMDFTLEEKNINNAFVTDSWTIVRNVANLAFIFILLYIAIATILGIGNYQQILIYLVIVALLVNFSAFFTKIVIDASNIIALEFRSAIDVSTSGGSMSGLFTSAFDPQMIMGSDSFKNWIDSGKSAAPLFFVFVGGAVVLVFMAYALLKGSFLLLGRMVAFWFLIIASPIAFISFILPNTRSLFSKWWNQLLNQAFLAPVFLFFIYVISKIVTSGFIKNAFPVDTTGDFIDIFINVILMASVLIFTLFAAIKITENMSGQAGSMIKKVVKLPAEMSTMPARKLLTAGMRGTVGRGASRTAGAVAGSEFARRMPTLGRFTTSTLDKAGGAAYDKYQKEQEKKKVAYGARVSGATRSEKRERLREEEPIRERLRTAQESLPKAQEQLAKAQSKDEIASAQILVDLAQKRIDAEQKALDVMKEGGKEMERARREEVARAYERPGILGRVAGTDVVDMSAAQKIRKGIKDKPEKEKIADAIEKMVKEGSEKTPEKGADEGDKKA